MFERYAIYFTRPVGDPLGAFGAAWLGRDINAGCEVAHPDISGLPLPIEQITRTPRKYGLHGTMKAPFFLRDGMTQDGLEAAVANFAATRKPLDLGRFEIGNLGRFVALVLGARNEAFADLVSDCVVALDEFRAPMSAKEEARRLQANLTPQQQHFMRQWGYPYIFDEFKFHVTLTDALDAGDVSAVISALSPHLDPLLAQPVTLDDLTLCGQTGDGNFQVIKRFALLG